MLNEREVLHNIRLSDIQKEVLAKTIAAPNEDVAADQILDGGRNYVGAKNILVRLGLMTFHDNEAAITQTGHQVMQRANLIDETGQLTDEGQKFAYTDEEDQQQQGQQQQQQPDQQQQQDQAAGWGGDQQQQVDRGPLPGTGPSFGESFSLIRSVHEQLQFENQLKRFTNGHSINEAIDADPDGVPVYSRKKNLQGAYRRGYVKAAWDITEGRGKDSQKAEKQSPFNSKKEHEAYMIGYKQGEPAED